MAGVRGPIRGRVDNKPRLSETLGGVSLASVPPPPGATPTRLQGTCLATHGNQLPDCTGCPAHKDAENNL